MPHSIDVVVGGERLVWVQYSVHWLCDFPVLHVKCADETQDSDLDTAVST